MALAVSLQATRRRASRRGKRRAVASDAPSNVAPWEAPRRAAQDRSRRRAIGSTVLAAALNLSVQGWRQRRVSPR